MHKIAANLMQLRLYFALEVCLQGEIVSMPWLIRHMCHPMIFVLAPGWALLSSYSPVGYNTHVHVRTDTGRVMHIENMWHVLTGVFFIENYG